MHDMRLHFLFDLCDKITTHIRAQVFSSSSSTFVLFAFLSHVALNNSLANWVFKSNHTHTLCRTFYNQLQTLLKAFYDLQTHKHILSEQFIVRRWMLSALKTMQCTQKTKRKTAKRCNEIKCTSSRERMPCAQIGKCLCKIGMVCIEFDSFSRRNENDMALQ